MNHSYTVAIFNSVATRSVEPDTAAIALLALDNAKSWKRFVCYWIGHGKAVSMPLDHTRWMCPRCGHFNSVVGGHSDPGWGYDKYVCECKRPEHEK